MKILAIETATEACSAALFNDGEIICHYELAPRKHTQLILPMMDAILDEAAVTRSSLDAIAFGCGPGAFTGLRIAVGIAQGLALAVDKPVIPISTLGAMAQQVFDNTSTLLTSNETTLIPAIDARMGEVYWGQYKQVDGEVFLQGQEQLSKPEVLASFNSDQEVRFGSGWEAYHPKLMKYDSYEINNATSEVFPSAYYVAKLAASAFSRGEMIDAADAEPVYLRNDVAKKKADQGKPS
jgi:tRNA threonylcarbamoyladenosine biosynthesis protein TsaB